MAGRSTLLLMNIYYLEGQETRGPFDRTGFVQLVHSGVIQPDTLVYTEKLGAWKSYSAAYYDLFPESRPAFPIAAPAQGRTRPPAIPQVASHPDESVPTPPQQQQVEPEYDGDHGLLASLFAFWALYGKWVIIIAVVSALAWGGTWMAENREQWMDNAITMKDKQFKTGEAKSAAKKASREWKRAAKHLAAENYDKALEAYEVGYDHVDFAWRFHPDTEISDGVKVKDLIRESAKPFNEVLSGVHAAVLERYAKGEIDGEMYQAFHNQFDHVVHSDIDSVWKKKKAEVDAARARFANKIFRIEFNLDHPDGKDAENEEYLRIAAAIEQEIRAKAQAPNGYRVEFGPPAGQMEDAATVLSANVNLGMSYTPYYFDPGKGQSYSGMETDFGERLYGPEVIIVNELHVQLLGYGDRERLNRNGVKTNWDQHARYTARIPAIDYVKLSKDAGEAERILVMAKYQSEVTRDLIRKVEADFKLPPLQTSLGQ
ncbi:MAG: GYF domain-containing protein [Puniceicoccales bacterium]